MIEIFISFLVSACKKVRIMASIQQHSEDTQANRLIKFGMALGVRAAIHPFEYSKVLIQVHFVCP